MKEIKHFINIFLFLNILTYSLEIVPNWNIATAAVKLDITFNADNKYKYNEAQNDITGHYTIYSNTVDPYYYNAGNYKNFHHSQIYYRLV